ncbi:MAG: hypothetical protein K8T26_15990 [Lentisphaerae bacterium]|nr:hypothetical protein [Lentisphaerota bacterium]
MSKSPPPVYTAIMDSGDEPLRPVSATPAAPQAPTPPESMDHAWIGRREIAAIDGALKASAYVARAYHHQKEHGDPPAWARKLTGGQWLFDRRYIAADARENLATIGITEAATLVGATRRAVQTWVDEGLIPTLTGDRPKGESRRIPRETFMQVLPDLKQRLRTAAPPAPRSASSPPATPDTTPADTTPLSEDALRDVLQRKAAAEESRIAAEVSRELSEAEDLRHQLARKRAVAERRLRKLARDEQRAQEREARLKTGYAERLREARRESRAADRRRTAAAERARRTAAKEQQLLATERKLRDSLGERIAEWRRRSAALIAAQLQEARAMLSKAPPTPAPPEPAARTDQDRRRSAAAVAAQLHAARAQHQQRSQLEDEIDRIAARLAEEVATGRRDRYDAAILFNEIMEQRAVPDELRIAVMKRHFSKG